MKPYLIAALLLCAACEHAERPEAPTPAEAERLNEADAMLNSLANEEGPATKAADPSANSN